MDARFTATLALLVIMPLWSLRCSAGKEDRAVKRIGRHLERIHKVDRAFSLKKMDASSAAAAMFVQVQGIQRAAEAVPDSAAIHERLQRFLSVWTSAERIRASLADGRQAFMAEVTGFYLHGLVERRSEGRTLFHLFRP